MNYKLEGTHWDDQGKVILYINLKLAAMGEPIYGNKSDNDFLEIAHPLLVIHLERVRLLSNFLCPVDRRIQDFIDEYLKGVELKLPPRIPASTFILDRQGLARIMSLPPNQDHFFSSTVNSYRVKQGVLHNPKSDRRTTQGVFHIAEGGFPIPEDKLSVPKIAFGRMLAHALNPPEELLQLPFTAAQEHQAKLFVSLLLRPVVCPEVSNYIPEKSMEIRFFAPGSLVSNLDFVESIFGNGGSPYLPENDAALDTEHWTGHTGCVILAPHLVCLTKKELGLPHYDNATDKQRREGMCWRSEEDLYNDGEPFKITGRDQHGVIVTIIADNYFGYCKKEVKTQISYSANLFGLAEEEHAGGAIAFPSFDLGEEFHLDDPIFRESLTFKELARLYGSIMDVKPEGYGVDKKHPDIIYVPENAKFDMPKQSITWTLSGKEQKIKLLISHTYVLPNGYKIFMKKQTGGNTWHLIGIVAEGTFCHKPCTVSGGGKSEISKSIINSMIQGPIFVSDFHKDMDMVAEILKRNFAHRFKNPVERNRPSRPILSPLRSLGSVIKLFTPSPEYNDEFNAWLGAIPHHILEIIFLVKRFYLEEWGDDWRQYFSVDVVNGRLGHELKYRDQKLVANYLRVGQEKDGSWRIYRVRQDFAACEKIQMEDDITSSIVVSQEHVNDLNPDYTNPDVKLVTNCEQFLFQRPDEAIHRGYDKQAEQDLSSPNTFLSNFEPLNYGQAQDLIQDAIGFDLYTEPVKNLIRDFIAERKPAYIVSSAHPRLVGGKPSKNPRYLQQRPDLANPRQKYLAETGTRFIRKAPADQPVHFPVNAVLTGRRGNPPDSKNNIPALAVYNPIHYQELPELFMDFISSVTGKSPSTTGFGSEGALTKGPFNALWPIVDLNNTLVSWILTGSDGFSSAAGSIGPNYRVDHDISLLVPEIWARMTVAERDPKFLIAKGYLEKLNDFDYQGKKVHASLLGYRITMRFAHTFLGRIFNNPNAVFHEEMLAPEKQDMAIFIQGIDNIVTTQQRVARHYFEDGSVSAASPPLKALLHIMAFGNFEGKLLTDPSIRALFTREHLLNNSWYRERLVTKQLRDIALWSRHIKYLEQMVNDQNHKDAVNELNLRARLTKAKEHLNLVQSPTYLDRLNGTIGADPFTGQM